MLCKAHKVMQTFEQSCAKSGLVAREEHVRRRIHDEGILLHKGVCRERVGRGRRHVPPPHQPLQDVQSVIQVRVPDRAVKYSACMQWRNPSQPSCAVIG
jgi:hypothetical protein